ncbi:ATP-binding protein [Cupriavidus basilensis]|uniref:ATP/GTP-binding protein n=1 Tax=Cupriavidus basilensis TaxID=68895 RepID=UPI0039F72209
MRIVISGTYSTGKSTTTDALGYLTGMPRTNARTMREIMPEALPGKVLEQCSIPELMELCLWRFKERVVSEHLCGDTYISDGSCLHEWIYARGRLIAGINPANGPVTRGLRKLLGLRYRPTHEHIFERLMHAVEAHARASYEEVIHLPIEFPMTDDGHRPVSEAFRRMTERMLLERLQALGIPCRVVGGSIEQRLAQITALYGWPHLCSIPDAIAMARANAARIEQESNARHQSFREGMSWRHRLARGLSTL